MYIWQFVLERIRSGIFSVSASVCDSRNWNCRSNSFVRERLRGAAQTPLALPYRSAPGQDRVRGLSETSEKCADFCILGGIRPIYFWILAYAELERKNHIGNHLLPSWHHFQIGFLCRLHHTFFMVTPRSVWPSVQSYDWLLLLSISEVTVKYLCSSVRCLRGEPFPTQQHRYTQ